MDRDAPAGKSGSQPVTTRRVSTREDAVLAVEEMAAAVERGEIFDADEVHERD